MNKPRILDAGISDLEDLVAIDRQCFPRAIAYDKDELAYYISRAGARTILAEVDGKTVGFLIVSVETFAPRATLVTLDVIARHRHAGIGSALLERAEQFLREQGVALIELQVDTANRVAISFYEKYGFGVCGTLAAYYPTGADAYVMRKKLGSTKAE